MFGHAWLRTFKVAWTREETVALLESALNLRFTCYINYAGLERTPREELLSSQVHGDTPYLTITW